MSNLVTILHRMAIYVTLFGLVIYDFWTNSTYISAMISISGGGSFMWEYFRIFSYFFYQNLQSALINNNKKKLLSKQQVWWGGTGIVCQLQHLFWAWYSILCLLDLCVASIIQTSCQGYGWLGRGEGRILCKSIVPALRQLFKNFQISLDGGNNAFSHIY